ncbi:hypothetical protein BAR24066_01496 [Burkholderia arboris]|uniref:Uncharacterized protein n=1 Tax=Burkholderia arboris TaxID=488730 RepID=A0A9Q9SFC8_9BURK|nr:hypothetical protein BAR24066_01496 [Burkholderia arboris]
MPVCEVAVAGPIAPATATVRYPYCGPSSCAEESASLPCATST